jgi:hypothetical protein
MNRTRTNAIARWIAAAGLAVAATGRAQPPGLPSDAYIGEQVSESVARMYERGLLYLVRTQKSDGSWANEGGQTGSAIQGLALMALVADGGDPRYGPYAAAIRRGLNQLLANQQDNGFLGSSMYHHAFGTLALAELYGVVEDDRIGPALVRAVDLIVRAQTVNQSNAWRYGPDSNDADTTLSGGILVALFAARNAGIEVDDEVIQRGLAFIRSCQDGSGGIGYTQPGDGSAARNAIGVLVASLANEPDSTFTRGAFAWLKQNAEQAGGSYYFYYLYYAAQAYFRADMTEWRAWNRQLIRQLGATQNAAGGWDGPQGSTFCTSAALLSMALNYRYLPIYER